MLALMIFRSFTRGWRRKLLAVISIALGACLTAAMLNLSLDVGDKMARELRAYGANLTIKPKVEKAPAMQANVDYDPLAAASYLDESDLSNIKMIFWRHNIVAFAPFLYGQGTAGQREVELRGTWFNKKLVLETGETIRTGIRRTRPWVKVEGSWPSDRTKDRQALVGRKVASALGVGPGDSLTVDVGDRRIDLTVAGVIKAGGEADGAVMMPLALLQEGLERSGKINEAEVSALTTPENELAQKYRQDETSLSGAEWERWYCTPYVDSIAYQIEEVVPGSTAKPVRQVAETEGIILAKIQLLMLLLAVAALASTALAISSFMTAIVLERSKEVGLSKAVGASDFLVVSVFLAEAGLLGLIGGTAGYGLGVVFSQAVATSVFGAVISIKAIVLPLTLIISLLVTLGGSLAAVRTIIQLNPKEVLHG